MTLQIKVDNDGKPVLVNGNLVLVDDVAQRVRTRLRMFLGEWFLDTADGTPYFQDILVKSPNLVLIRSAIRERILETEGVTGIEKFDMTFDRVYRTLAVTAACLGPSGRFEVTL